MFLCETRTSVTRVARSSTSRELRSSAEGTDDGRTVPRDTIITTLGAIRLPRTVEPRPDSQRLVQVSRHFAVRPPVPTPTSMPRARLPAGRRRRLVSRERGHAVAADNDRRGHVPGVTPASRGDFPPFRAAPSRTAREPNGCERDR